MRLALLLLLVLGFLSPAEAARRVALVIGNSAYVHANALANPRNDAADVAKKLTDLGFEVTRGQDLDLNSMTATVRNFIKTLEGAELSAFYYAGHGLQVNGVNYMVPVDARLASEDDVTFEALAMDKVLTPMERASRTNLVFLDACRDNPLAKNLARSMGTRSAVVGAGLAQFGGGVGTLIAFATQPGNVALDGNGRNSPFTTALLKHIGTPGQDIMKDLVMVRRDVIASTDGQQVPWDNNSLTGDVILQPGTKAVAAVEPLKLPEPKAEPKIDNSLKEGFINPTAAFPYDGYWSVTRIASRLNGRSTCTWATLQNGFAVSQGKIEDQEWAGNVDASGKFDAMNFFIDDETGKKGKMRYTGQFKGDTGSGKYKRIAGGCNGTLKLAREK